MNKNTPYKLLKTLADIHGCREFTRQERVKFFNYKNSERHTYLELLIDNGYINPDKRGVTKKGYELLINYNYTTNNSARATMKRLFSNKEFKKWLYSGVKPKELQNFIDNKKSR